MSFIQCISYGSCNHSNSFYYRLFLHCFRDDNPEMIGNTEYTNFSLPCFDPPFSKKEEVREEYILLTEQYG